MNSLSFIFPGQGSQYNLMGLSLYNNYQIAKKIFSKSNIILGYDIREMCCSENIDSLNKTEFTQPAIFIISTIVDTILKKEKNMFPKVVAGHSLGEFSAIHSANVLNFEDSLNLINIRAKEMAIANSKAKGAMAAVLYANNKEINSICSNNSCDEGIVVKANINSDNQVVISGDEKAIDKAIIYSKTLSKKIKCIKLNVSGAFHSPLMTYARKSLSNALNSLNFNDASCPVYQNTDPSPIIDGLQIKDNLLNQLESPVRWSETIKNIRKNEMINNFIEVGPKNVLSKINKTISLELISKNFGTYEEIEEFTYV